MTNIINIAAYLVATYWVVTLAAMILDRPVRDPEFQGKSEYLEELRDYRKDALIALLLAVVIAATAVANFAIGSTISLLALVVATLIPVGMILTAE